MRKKYSISLIILNILLCVLFLSGCVLDSKTVSSILENIDKEVEEAEIEQEIFEMVNEIEVADNFYYSHLSEDHKMIYRQLIAGIERYDTGISLNADSIEDVDFVLNEVFKDCPEYFWIGKEGSGNGVINDMGIYYSFIPLYNTEIADIDYIRKQIANTADYFIQNLPVDADTYTKVVEAYEWVITNTDYVENCAYSQNILSVFLNHESVCAGYARAFQYIMNKLEIPCIYVEGDAGDPAEPHAWNMVNIDGLYYYVDCTWGDQSYIDESTGEEEYGLSYDYLCLLADEISRTHKATDGYEYPISDNIQYDYFYQNGWYYDSYDENVLSQACYDSVTAGETVTYLKYSSEEAYLQAKSAVKEGSVLDDAAYYMLDQTGVEEYWYYYLYNDDIYTLKIEW